MKFKEAELKKVAVFNLSQLSIFSQILYSSPDTKVPVSLQSSATSTDSSSPSGDSLKETRFNEFIEPPIDSASCSSHKTSVLNFRSCILHKFRAVISVEKPLLKGNDSQYSSQVWAGDGFISHCDLIITITEIKVSISIVYSAFLFVFRKKMISFCIIYILCFWVFFS